MAELWDLYTAEREALNKTGERGTVLPKNQFHTIIHAWIRRKSDGKFLVSQRVQNIFWGGYWQPTGGSAVHGETSLQAAIRECGEELGLNLADAKNSFLFSYRYAPPAPRNPSFFLDAWLFTIENEAENAQIKMQKNEVADFAWLTFDQIIELWQNGKFMPYEQTWPPYFSVLKICIAAPQSVKSLKYWACSLLQYFDYQQKYCQLDGWCEYFADEQNKNPNAQLDAALLLAHSLNCTKGELLLKAEETVELPLIEKMEKLLYQRLNGKAVAYLTEEKDFYFYNFYVNPAVLIPKPDTELLVEKAFDQIIEFWTANRLKKLSVLDLCCGSGCIGISVYKRLKEFLNYCRFQLEKAGKTVTAACHTVAAGSSAQSENEKLLPPDPDDDFFFMPAYQKLFAAQTAQSIQPAQNAANKTEENSPQVQLPALPKMYFSDISPEALKVAEINARRLLAGDFANFTFVQGDLLEPFLQSRQNGTAFSFDLLLTNPPYVPTGLTNSLLADGRGEPRLALDGGSEGLDLIERIISQVWTVLALNGIIFAETGEYNATQTAELLIGKGFAEVEIFKDMTEQLRLVKAKKIGRS